MKRKNKQKITLIYAEDTKKTYEFPCEENPQIWEIMLFAKCVNDDGDSVDYSSASSSIYVTRETLTNAGLLPKSAICGEDSLLPNKETPEELITKLLRHLGFFPEQESE